VIPPLFLLSGVGQKLSSQTFKHHFDCLEYYLVAKAIGFTVGKVEYIFDNIFHIVGYYGHRY